MRIAIGLTGILCFMLITPTSAWAGHSPTGVLKTEVVRDRLLVLYPPEGMEFDPPKTTLNGQRVESDYLKAHPDRVWWTKNGALVLYLHWLKRDLDTGWVTSVVLEGHRANGTSLRLEAKLEDRKEKKSGRAGSGAGSGSSSEK